MGHLDPVMYRDGVVMSTPDVGPEAFLFDLDGTLVDSER